MLGERTLFVGTKSTKLRTDGCVMEMYRSCYFKRRSFLVSVMVCGFLCFALYTLTLSCCAVVNSGLEQALLNSAGSNIIIIDSKDKPGERYQIQLAPESKDQQHSSHKRILRKALAEDVPISYEAHDHRRAHRRRTHSSEKGYDTPVRFEKAEEDELNGYTLEDETEPESSDQTENNLNEMDYTESKSQRTKESKVNKMTRLTKSGTKRLPEALIIGVKKGGTRALLEFLRVHPDIRSPGPEPHFFDRHYDRGLEWYREQMPPTLEGQMTIEKTPSYFVTKGVPGRIFNMSKDMKLIVVVRDPVTRAISDYTQAASKRPDVRPFEEMAFLDNITGLVDTSWGAIRIGVYAKHLERWLKYFSLSQMHFVSGEKLITDPASELEKVQDFLGLKRVISEKHFYFNSTKGFPCLKKPEGSGNPHCLGKTKGRHHPDVDPKVLKRLRDFYRPFNAKFYQMTNQNFGWP